MGRDSLQLAAHSGSRHYVVFEDAGVDSHSGHHDCKKIIKDIFDLKTMHDPTIIRLQGSGSTSHKAQTSFRISELEFWSIHRVY